MGTNQIIVSIIAVVVLGFSEISNLRFQKRTILEIFEDGLHEKGISSPIDYTVMLIFAVLAQSVVLFLFALGFYYGGLALAGNIF